MTGRGAVVAGAASTTIVGVCCVTPLLPITLGALGLGALTPLLYRDAVLLPLLGLSLLLTGVAVWRLMRRPG